MEKHSIFIDQKMLLLRCQYSPNCSMGPVHSLLKFLLAFFPQEKKFILKKVYKY